MNKNLLAGILAVVLANQLTISQGGKIKTGIEVIDALWTLYGIFKETHEGVDAHLTPDPTTSDILSAVNDVARNVDLLGTQLVRKMDIILDTILNRLPEIIEIGSDMRLLRGYVQRIDFLYDEFRSFSTNCSDWNPSTLLEFSDKVTDHGSDGVASTMDSIFSILGPRRTEVFPESLMPRIIKNFKHNELNACDKGTSPQQEIYDFYTTILMTELKGWLLISFAHTFRSSFDETNSNATCSVPFRNKFIREQNRALDSFQKRVGNYTSMFHEAMPSISRALRRCDPSNDHTRGNTFHEFQRFIHGYIIQEEEMNPDHRCTRECESQICYSDVAFFSGIGPTSSSYQNSKCYGQIIDCKSIRSTEICFSSCQNCKKNHVTPRRYHWFKDGHGNEYGNTNEECGGELLLQSRSRRIFVFCDICLCTCIEDGQFSPATRFVSLRKVVSDIENNKVMTGVKFISVNRVIQIQIQEGKLAENGRIESGSESWKAPEEIQYWSIKSSEAGEPRFRMITPYPNLIDLELDANDVKVFDFSNRKIHLDELHVPKDHVMTGIKFDRAGGWPFPAIQLSIRATPFDYAKGKLVNEANSIWITPDNMRNILAPYKRRRTGIVYGDDMENPIKQVSKTTPNFEPNKFIEITKTSLRSDAGQTVIPLLDGLEVMGSPAVPLSGINLFHKSADKYGGFLSFQIEAIDKTEDMIFVGMNQFFVNASKRQSD